ncbi:MAG TPA: cutinase family protein [Acidimicrobiia bacterium]|nr:cutinase family protein [Acidimicrobiia bacterium]
MWLAAISLIVALIAPAPSITPECSMIHVIGARGSGQSNGFGDQVEPVVKSIVAVSTSVGLSATSEALDYPAISISDSLGLALINGEYDASVRAGVNELWAAIGRVSRACPSTDIVLVGYSQGAQVIKTALAGTVPTHRIATVVLLADPTRDPAQIGLFRLGDPTTLRTGAFGAIALPDHVRTVTLDVCAAGDGICERGRRDFLAHTEGYRDAAGWVTSIVERRLDARARWALVPR